MNRNSFLESLESANTFLVLTHIRPDGDAIASSLAIYEVLINLGKKSKNIEVFIPNISKDLSFIDQGKILIPEVTRQKYDIVIVVDCSDFMRIEGNQFLNYGSKCINIDHHERTGTPIETTYSFVDTSASSCTCIIYREFTRYIIKDNRYYFDRYISIGILSDTIGLTHNVTEECKSILNTCKSNGINTDAILEQLNTIDVRTKKLADVAIKNYFTNDGIGCSYIHQSDLIAEERNLKTVNHKAIIQILLDSFKCDTLILLIENENNELKVQ